MGRHIQYANFVEHPCDRERFHDRDTLRRLQRIKAAVDPDGMFLASHPIPADQPSPTAESGARGRCLSNVSGKKWMRSRAPGEVLWQTAM